MAGTELAAVSDDEALLLAVLREFVAERHTLERAASATLDSALDRDLGLDSLAVAELLARIEDTFGVSLERGVLATATVPRDVLAAVRRAPRREPRQTRVRHNVPERVHRIPDEIATLTEALCWHARTHPDRVHLRLLGDETEEPVSYGDLRRDAGTVAAGLLARDLRPGDAVAVMLPTGRDYFAGFTGILLAGGVPVPIYPPARPSQLAEHLRRQARILDNARARLLITDPEAALPARLLRGHVESVRHVLTPAELSGHGETRVVRRSAADTALLQYTSGSTGDPKGVVLTHANLLANIRAMGKAAQVCASDVFVSWLPLYHDMGLIGAWLSSLYFGLPLAVMSPVAFLSRPSRWLWAVHTHRGTLSAAPNFAYELCLRKIGDAEVEGLDLSSLRMAFNGAEPVNATTVARFAERFGRYGLRRGALAPVYGLAEACVGLTFPPVGRQPIVDRVAREEFLRTGRATPAADDDPDPLRFVACGRPIPGHEIRVVDAATNELGDRREGRIEFRGPSATAGYFRNPQATRALTRHGWIDTGDLGYLDGGELYVTGRVKDLIIRAGRNLHPDELEHAVGEIPGVRKGCVAVFATPGQAGGTERLVVLAETRQTDAAALAAMRARIIAVTVDLLGTPADDVVLVGPGVVPKTSSGKIRRAASRERYERGELGASHRPVWWQLARFAARAVLPRLRRVGRIGSTVAFAAWCWSLLVAVGLPTLIAMALLPGLAARQTVTRRAARSLARLTGTRITATGADRLAQLPACVVVANHASYLDGIAMAAALPGRYTFVAGEVFATKPLIGFLLRRIGTRFVERAVREQALADTQRLADAARGGERLVLFPEGSLSPVSGLRPFHTGAFVIAASAGLPVVPVAISGTRAMMWPDHGAIIRRGAVHLAVGEPITATDGGWDAAVAVERTARSVIAEHCGEPDLGR
ncbi:AMP-binding protein [Pseudonocardia acidicola]|uniref:AMP-binding protein n=1 Tax=Pseudonocardia acidicola TaxID=2724939 RepID=A0ABX1SG92_9PSEU|nr:AMP-binding protein [Pseudonocardia acidicola]NMH99178.1 AMP-binding protein [Pseudonocardia acidicola]